MSRPAFHHALFIICAAGLLGTPAYGQTETPAPAAPRTQCQQAPSLGQVFIGTAGNFRQLADRENLLWLAGGAGIAVAAHAADTEVGRSLSGSARLHETFEAGSIVGGTPLVLGAAFTTYAVARALNHSAAACVAADLVQAQLMAEILTAAIKQSTRRSRPEGAGFSFPSGHTAVTFASATVLQRHFGWKAGLPAYAVATYVATSRVQMKRHYLSDVAFGAAVGIVSGRTVPIGGGRKLLVTPMATPGGAGVSFTVLER